LPPYVIFHDRTLIEMAVYKPKTLEDMGHINGVGQSKLERYGQSFLSVMNGHSG
jgi:ATP-dependent DNA helicase RecQ